MKKLQRFPNSGYIGGVCHGLGLHTFSFAIRLIRLRFPQHQKRVYIVVVILLFFLLWAELGVGIFGSPIAGD